MRALDPSASRHHPTAERLRRGVDARLVRQVFCLPHLLPFHTYMKIDRDNVTHDVHTILNSWNSEEESKGLRSGRIYIGGLSRSSEMIKRQIGEMRRLEMMNPIFKNYRYHRHLQNNRIFEGIAALSYIHINI